MEQQIIEGNKLIYNSPFGKYFRDNQSYLESCMSDGISEKVFYTEKVKYHSDWNWLMLVIEKIKKNHPHSNVINLPIASPTELVWLAVIEFIKFLNNNKAHS